MKIPVSEPNLCGNEQKYVNDCLETNWISSIGHYVDKFEEEFAKYINSKYASSCSSGTSALHLIMSALNINKKDEVILPTFTFVSSANSIVYNNAKPVFVDSEYDTWNMDVSKIEGKITNKTKAIMAVHIYGHPVDLDPLIEICEKNDLYLIEDAAESIGSKYKNKKVGGIGYISAFSFYGNKTITTGEGGMITSNNKELIDKVNNLKNQGKSKIDRYWHDIIGYNYRMANIPAAIGLAQLENVENFIRKKREIAKFYRDTLNVKGIEHATEKDYAYNSYWMSSIILTDDLKIKREYLQKKLFDNGIETRPFFYPMHILPIFKKYIERKSDYNAAEYISKRGINLPSSTKITDEQLEYICNNIYNIIEKRGKKI